MKKLLIIASVLASFAAKANEESIVTEIVYEAFSLPLAEATKFQLENVTDQEKYQQLLAQLEDGSAIQEFFMAARANPGTVGIVQHCSELIYPTEVTAPVVPRAITFTGDEATGFPAIPAMPIAFDTKYLGDTLEFEAKVDAGQAGVELRVSGNHVKMDGTEMVGRGVSSVEMPRAAIQSVGFSGIVKDAVPTLIGTMNPSSELKEQGQPRIWFAFVTSRVVNLEK